MKIYKLKMIKKLIAIILIAFTACSFTGCDALDEFLNRNNDFTNDGIDTPISPDDGGETPDIGGETPDDGNETPDDGNETPDIGGEMPDDGNSGIVEGQLTEITGAELSIHFLELGNKYAGDCTLIKSGDCEVLIDAGSRKGSAATLKSYIDNYCTDGKLEYVIATHSDQDHIAAFVGNSSGGKKNGILYSYEIGTLIKFDNSTATSQIYSDFLEAVEYTKTQGTAVYTASQCYEQTDGAQRQYYLDEEQKISLNILYNYYYYNVSSDQNNHSVVTLLTQVTDGGKLNYLFTGDLEKEGEEYLVDYYKNVPTEYATEFNVLPEVELYKAGHHGSKTSSSAALLAMIKPKNVAVCCCCGSPEYTTNNENTFPTQIMIDNVKQYTENIYVTTLATFESEGDFEDKKYGYTSMNGNIVFYYTTELNLYCSNNTTKLKDTEWFKANRTW